MGETDCAGPPYFCHRAPIQPFCPSAGGPLSTGAKFTRGIPDPTIQTCHQIRGLTQKILPAKNNPGVLSVIEGGRIQPPAIITQQLLITGSILD